MIWYKKWKYDLPNMRRKDDVKYQIFFGYDGYFIKNNVSKKEYFIQLAKEHKKLMLEQKTQNEKYNKATKYLKNNNVI